MTDDSTAGGLQSTGYARPWTEGRTDAPVWYCGAHVTAKYVKIFGRNGELQACLHCTNRGDISDGGGIPDGD
jgi:hypothetical protein